MLDRFTMRKVLAAVLLSGLAVAGGCTQLQDWSSEQAKRKAEALAMQRVGEAQQAQSAGDLQQAMTLFNKALDSDPHSLPAHMGVGDIYQLHGDFTKAAQQYDAARQAQPQNFQANYKFALMEHLLGKIREAVEAYLSALTINPEDYAANLNVATAYLQLNQPQLALPYAEKAVKLDPRSQAALVNLGAVYSAVGRNLDAVECYRGAANLGELSQPIALNLVNALVKIDKLSRARNTLGTLIHEHPVDARYHERLGYVEFKAGHYDQSIAAYQAALKLAPKDTPSLNGLGANYITRYLQGNRDNISLRDQGLAAWRQSVQIDPTQSRIIDLIGRYGSL